MATREHNQLSLDRIVSDSGFSPEELHAFCQHMTQVLALPGDYAVRIQAALQKPAHLRLVWLSGQDCAGDTEALLRVAAPPLTQVLLDYLSLEYHELLMVPSGGAAEQLREETIRRFPHGYVAVVEGAIPTAEDGIYCTVGGRAFSEIVREVCTGAAVTIAVGSCAWDGGLPAAVGSCTDAIGVEQLLPGLPIVNLPGCPINGENLLAVIVFYLTFGELPPMDVTHLPLFAYGTTVHANCERLPHFKAREFAKEFGDEGYRQGYCLLNLGCKGVYAFANCPVVQFNDGQSWCIAAGAPCTGCSLGRFWDEMPPFYQRGRARLAHGTF